MLIDYNYSYLEIFINKECHVIIISALATHYQLINCRFVYMPHIPAGKLVIFHFIHNNYCI